MVEGTAERLEFHLILTPFGSAFHLLFWSSAVRFSIQCPAVQTLKHSGRTCQTKRARIQFSNQSKTILLGSQTINKLKTVRRQQSVWTRTKICTTEAADHRVFTSAITKSLWTAKQKRRTVEKTRLRWLRWRKRVCCPVLCGGQTPRCWLPKYWISAPKKFNKKTCLERGTNKLPFMCMVQARDTVV